ncbi:hypothetical protein GWI33_011959 [Rhynchophorus ferrugineus]|uniref:Uncharacterized protein n=1 Tax=Rhynchophorus ferrugineus TaxID=354439 RepID=A0A834IU16_RHYFE|nr:hypothetical protein GWI33_011959 [Rhynchophorus ferrugineus]
MAARRADRTLAKGPTSGHYDPMRIGFDMGPSSDEAVMILLCWTMKLCSKSGSVIRIGAFYSTKEIANNIFYKSRSHSMTFIFK